MPKNLFDKIVNDENLEKAYKQTQTGKGKYNPDALVFASDETYNLSVLKESLIDETYQFDGYTTFEVFEPKERTIDAPSYKDKIIQIAINNILKEVYYPCFIYDSYACIDSKGTHKCVDRIQYFMRKARWEYGEDAHIIKIDIKKFFYTINREILKKLLLKKIMCRKTLRLLFKIIDSADVLSVLGMPLGNTLSQICANIYMNEIDQIAKRRLSLKYYVRYADDTIIILKDKEKSKAVLSSIKAIIKERLDLEVNDNKTKIFPIKQGVNTVGFKIYATHRLLRNDSKKKMKRKAKKMRILLAEGKMKPEKAEQILNSWKGHAQHGNSYNFIKKLLEKNDYIYANKRGVLKVDMNKLRKEGERFAN